MEIEIYIEIEIEIVYKNCDIQEIFRCTLRKDNDL